jgi:hypothetical protein
MCCRGSIEEEGRRGGGRGWSVCRISAATAFAESETKRIEYNVLGCNRLVSVELDLNPCVIIACLCMCNCLSVYLSVCLCGGAMYHL